MPVRDSRYSLRDAVIPFLLAFSKPGDSMSRQDGAAFVDSMADVPRALKALPRSSLSHVDTRCSLITPKNPRVCIRFMLLRRCPKVE